MTLSEILSEAGGYYFKRENGEFIVYDEEDDYFEERAKSVKGVLDIISGWTESMAYGMVEDISNYLGEPMPKVNGWEWKDYKEWLSTKGFNTKNGQALNAELERYMDFVEMLDYLINPDEIEII